MLSYIVSIDNSYSLISNFIGHLIPILAPDDEVIIVSDGCDKHSVLEYLKLVTTQDSRCKHILLEDKHGFAGANNIGVEHSKSDTLIFINSDVFLTHTCITSMLELLYSSELIAAVQPMLVYPQNGLIQSTGHVFSSNKSGQLFSYRSPQEPLVKQTEERQALTMALCAMKRSIFYEMGGLNEKYFNSHEGMELTLKISLNGYKCMYCSEALAFHCSGIARSKTEYGITRQRIYFYQKWQSNITVDLEKYLSRQINIDMENQSYIVYNLSSSVEWAQILKGMRIKIINEITLKERFNNTVNLYDCISFTSLHYPVPYIFVCDSISQLMNNQNWIKSRNNPNDLIMDLNGNLIPLVSLTK